VKLFSRRRLLRAVVVWCALAAVTAVLTVRERRRMEASAVGPASTSVAGPLDGPTLLADIQRLASPAFEGRRTGTAGSRAAQAFIIERLRSSAVAPLFDGYRQPFAFTHRSIKGLLLPSRPYETEYPEAANVGGIIRGSSKAERFIALTAHYDSFGIRDGQLFPGADDNASGVAVMLGVAGEIAKQPLGHSLLLLAFDAEELGIRGARHFVQHPPVALTSIDVVVNLDMVGRGDENTLVAAGAARHPALESAVRAAAAGRSIRTVFGHDRPIYKAGLVENWTHSSDHGPFHDAAVPFIYLGVEDHADYHQTTDTAARIPAAFLGEVGNLVLGLLRNLDR
jgi:hypothetical protein